MSTSRRRYDSRVVAAVPVQHRPPVNGGPGHVGQVHHVVEAPRNGHGPLEHDRVVHALRATNTRSGCLRSTFFNRGTVKYSSRRPSRCTTTAISGTPDVEAALRRRARRRQPRQADAGDHRDAQQHQDVGARRHTQAPKRQHPIVEKPVDMGVEAERQLEGRDQPDDVHHHRAAHRRPEPDDQQADRDEPGEQMPFGSTERLGPAIELIRRRRAEEIARRSRCTPSRRSSGDRRPSRGSAGRESSRSPG